MVVASPAHVERHGRPANPRELRRHRCINFRRPTDLSLYRWEFERGPDKLETAVDGPQIVNEPDVACRAALDGVGIAYLFAHQVGAAVADSRPVRLLKDWSPPFPGFYLYYPSSRQMSGPLRAFIDFIGR